MSASEAASKDEAPDDPDLTPTSKDELVFGLVGAVGVDLGEVSEELRAALSRFGYHAAQLHLTDHFKAFEWPEGKALCEEPFDERLGSYMTAGDHLRETWHRNDAMALLAINQITLERHRISGDRSRPKQRTAFILQSLKRPEEVHRLRAVYGSRFLLISVTSPEERRKAYLAKQIRLSRVPPHSPMPAHTPEQLMARDEKEAHIDHGQDVRDTFHHADFFADMGQGLRAQLERLLDLLFGDPTRSPRRDEFGMFQATAAALRSADLGRQVGAAICSPDGTVLSLGTNEVPRAGGGLYWEGDDPDGRDVKRGFDPNRERREQIAQEIVGALGEAEMLAPELDAKLVQTRVERTTLADIIEYVRAVHAEMAALTDAARHGTRVNGAVIYVTTFPCHHCARHIVAAGLTRVVYVAPYAKSKAIDLHGDALAIGPLDDKVDPRVSLEPFVGLGPRRYLEFFKHDSRKDPNGKVLPFARDAARPRLADLDPKDLSPDRLPYLDRELRALDLLGSVEAETGFAMKRAS